MSITQPDDNLQFNLQLKEAGEAERDFSTLDSDKAYFHSVVASPLLNGVTNISLTLYTVSFD